MAARVRGCGGSRAASTNRRVHAERDTKSVSAETTFDQDLSTFRALEVKLWRLSERVSGRLKAQHLAGPHCDTQAQDR